MQTNSNLVRVRDVIHVDLMLGNHGNDHRDFKLAGKMDPQAGTCEVLSPEGASIDLRSTLVDVGYAPQEGFWTAHFLPAQAGLYTVSHLSDKVMSYGPVRSVKGAKAYFVATPSLDKPELNSKGFDRPLGHPLELVPLAHPVTPMGPGTPIRVQLVYKGRPLANGACRSSRAAIRWPKAATKSTSARPTATRRELRTDLRDVLPGGGAPRRAARIGPGLHTHQV